MRPNQMKCYIIHIKHFTFIIIKHKVVDYKKCYTMLEFISLKRLPCAHILFLSVITFDFIYIYIHNLNLIYHMHSKYTWHVFTQRLQQKQNACSCILHVHVDCQTIDSLIIYGFTSRSRIFHL